MKLQKVLSALVAVVMVALLIVVTSASSNAQEPTQEQQKQNDTFEDQTNLDTQLYLIVATNQSVVDEKLPTSLDSVVKQLRATLPFKNYRLAATLLNRVKNEGRLDLSWIGGPLAPMGTANSQTSPTFSSFKIRGVRLAKNAKGQTVVHMAGFNFGARFPIQMMSVASANAFPVINYENTGLQTDISMRESEPVIVGTLNVGPSGDALILVVSAKRTLR